MDVSGKAQLISFVRFVERPEINDQFLLPWWWRQQGPLKRW
jgi:hypothetical protein